LYCFTTIDSAAEEKCLAEWKGCVSQLILSERACGYRSCMPSQPLVTSTVLLPLRPFGYLAKFWIFIVELKQFLHSMYSLPGSIVTSYGGVVYDFF